MAQCRDCGKGYEGASGLCPTCLPEWLASAQATAADYARQWQAERIRAERLAEINRELLKACGAALKLFPGCRQGPDDGSVPSLLRNAIDKAKGISCDAS